MEARDFQTQPQAMTSSVHRGFRIVPDYTIYILIRLMLTDDRISSGDFSRLLHKRFSPRPNKAFNLE